MGDTGRGDLEEARKSSFTLSAEGQNIAGRHIGLVDGQKTCSFELKSVGTGSKKVHALPGRLGVKISLAGSGQGHTANIIL